MKVNTDLIKNLRDQTGAGVADCKAALSLSKGNLEKAQEVLRQKGLDSASSKVSRTTKAGLVEVYSHGGKVGVLVELLCETDFVAKLEDFKNLAHELALQIASMKPSSVSELLEQDYIREPGMKVKDLIKGVVAKLGENIKVARFERVALGE